MNQILLQKVGPAYTARINAETNNWRLSVSPSDKWLARTTNARKTQVRIQTKVEDTLEAGLVGRPDQFLMWILRNNHV